MPQDIRVACSGWQYTHWRGDFYPAELPTSRWFAPILYQLPPQWPINLERLEIFLRAIEPAARLAGLKTRPFTVVEFRERVGTTSGSTN